MASSKREKAQDLFEEVANRKGSDVFAKTARVADGAETSAMAGEEEDSLLNQNLKTVSIRITEDDQRTLAAYFRKKYNIGFL